MNYKLPRPNTRVRALFDELCRHPDGCVWRDLKDAYDDKAPAYDRRMFGPRYYSNMTISKYIRKFATHTGPAGKRVYKLRPEYARMLLTNPFYFLAYKDVDRAKIEAIADLPDIRKLADEIREGFDYLDAHRNEKPAEASKFRADMDPIKAGDWVKVVEADGAALRALNAHGIGKGTYQVEKVENGYVFISGCGGGWEPKRFAIVTRPPQNIPGPQYDKGAPEIRDMAWSSNYTEPAHNPFAHVYVEQVTKHNTQLQGLLQEAEERRKVLNHEIEKLKEQLEETVGSRDYLMGKSADWDTQLVKIRKMVGDIQHAEVGHVYTMIDDTISFIDDLLQDIRDS